MGKFIKIILVMGVLVVPSFADAEISFTNGKWSTTLNCADWVQNNTFPSCDGLDMGGGWFNQYGDQITSSANNPSGDGFKGFRHWEGPGSNIGGGGISTDFPTAQKELWIRWYMRYQSGFSWRDGLPQYDKILYIHSDGLSTDVIPEFYYNDFVLIGQNTGGADYYQVQASEKGWQNVNGGSVGDGKWHMYEIHIRMDTNGTDGIGEIWIDGQLQVSNKSVNWSGGNATARNGWTNMLIGSNQSYVANATDEYVDFDDITIYNTTPPNRDSAGNPYIGPIGSTGGGTTPTDTTPPSVPTLTATAVSSSQINLSWTASTDNVGVTGYKVYRNGTYLTTTTSTSYSNTSLTASTAYTYRVSAIDAAGNESSQSTAKSATTQVEPVESDTTPPAAPTGIIVS